MFDEDNNEPKKQLAATDSMRELLNLDEPVDPGSEPSQQGVPPESLEHAAEVPPDLPFLETLEEPQKNITEVLKAPEDAPPSDSGPAAQILGPAVGKGHEAYAFLLWTVKNVLPYLVVFGLAIGLYFFYFSDVSFTGLFKSSSLPIEKLTTAASDKELEKFKSQQKDDYNKWIAQFFFAVNDEDIISMDTDVSGNGLTNFEKYLLNLNPKVYSSRGLDKPDGELVTEGINPWTNKPFTNHQKELVDKYISKELISNRITAAALNRGVTKFAEYVTPDSPYYVDPDTQRQVQNNNPVITSPESASNQTAYQAAQQAKVTAAPVNLNPGSDINQNIPGKLEIPSVHVSVPLTWTKNVKDFDADLKKGVVHYPGTALPGQIGTSYISGHSSGYLWDHSPYKTVFAVLGNVKDGDTFTINATRNDGQLVTFHYVVAGRGEYAANDQTQFANTADSVVALSTCWPVGTTARRLVLYGKLTQTDQ